MDEIDQYDYLLPKELIAQQPLADRAAARMMVINRKTGEISHRRVADFVSLLEPEDVVVFNNTKVVPARLLGRRAQTGGRWEGLFLEIAPQPNGETALWRLMGSTRGKLLPGESVILENIQAQDDISLRFETKLPDGTWLVKPQSEENYLTILERVGRVPIPPYIRNGKMVESDRDNYQTVFAQVPGAVAAPTAGLHFTEEALNEIRAQGVDIQYVTLHVGIGTFKPISVSKLSEHQMHREYAQLEESAAQRLIACKKAGGRVVAIGTTSVRTLESAAQTGIIAPFAGQTNLFIKPPYRFNAVDVMFTNFHLPKSTLLVMIRTFGGDELLKEAYRQAIEQKYRFYSYGDCMVIL